MPIDVAIERSGETVSPLLRRLFGSTNRPLEAEYRNVYQSIKKLHGCLATPSPWCFCTDSETILIACMSMRGFVEQWAAHPTILYSSRYPPIRNGSARSTPAAAGGAAPERNTEGPFACVAEVDDMLLGNTSRPALRWTMENDHWLYEREVLVAFYAALRDRGATPIGLWARNNFPCCCRTKLFIEGTIYKWLHLQGHLHQTQWKRYHFVDTAPALEAAALPLTVPYLVHAWKGGMRFVGEGRSELASQPQCSTMACLTTALLDQQLNTSTAANEMARFLRRHGITTLAAGVTRVNSNIAERNGARRIEWPDWRGFFEAAGVKILTCGDEAGPLYGLAKAHVESTLRGGGAACTIRQ